MPENGGERRGHQDDGQGLDAQNQHGIGIRNLKRGRAPAQIAEHKAGALQCGVLDEAHKRRDRKKLGLDEGDKGDAEQNGGLERKGARNQSKRPLPAIFGPNPREPENGDHAHQALQRQISVGQNTPLL